MREHVTPFVDVIAHGRSVPIRAPMLLESGDEIETYADASALIRYPEGHEIQLLPNTRIRLGSIYVFWGEIRAFIKAARGYFRVESEFVSLDVEGTRFWFRVQRDQTISMGVSEGRVRLSSKAGRWPSILVRPGEAYAIPRDGRPVRQRFKPDDARDQRRDGRYDESVRDDQSDQREGDRRGDRRDMRADPGDEDRGVSPEEQRRVEQR